MNLTFPSVGWETGINADENNHWYSFPPVMEFWHVSRSRISSPFSAAAQKTFQIPREAFFVSLFFFVDEFLVTWILVNCGFFEAIQYENWILSPG